MKKYEICSKLTIETPEQPHWSRSGNLIINFEHIAHLFPVFLSLTLRLFHKFGVNNKQGINIFDVTYLCISTSNAR